MPAHAGIRVRLGAVRSTLVIPVTRDTLHTHTASGRVTFLTRSNPWQKDIAGLGTLGCWQIRAVTTLTRVLALCGSLGYGGSHMYLVLELPMREPAYGDF